MVHFIDVISLIGNVYDTSHRDRDLADRFDEISPRKQNRIIFSFVEDLSASHEKLFFGTLSTQIRHIVVDATANATHRAFSEFYIRFIKEEFSKTLSEEKVQMITSKILSQFESIYYHSIDPIKTEDIKGLRQLFKKNKKSNVLIRGIHSTLERVRNEGYHYYLAISVKVYERNHSILLELGTALYNSRSESISTRHYIVEEHSHLFNKTYVQDYRDDFRFGRPKTASLRKCLADLLNVLQLDDVALKDIVNIIDDHEVFDMMKIYRNYYRRPKFSKLRKMAKKFEDIQIGNAGNDANITIQAFQKFLSITKESKDCSKLKE
eukprot:gene7439-8022_t